MCVPTFITSRVQGWTREAILVGAPFQILNLSSAAHNNFSASTSTCLSRATWYLFGIHCLAFRSEFELECDPDHRATFLHLSFLDRFTPLPLNNFHTIFYIFLFFTFSSFTLPKVTDPWIRGAISWCPIQHEAERWMPSGASIGINYFMSWIVLPGASASCDNIWNKMEGHR